MITGYRALLISVAILYALAWVFATRLRVLADVGLSDEAEPAAAEAAAAG